MKHDEIWSTQLTYNPQPPKIDIQPQLEIQLQTSA
jgi:hypothetical protein